MSAVCTSEISLQQTIWRHFKIDLPSDWEMLRYSLNLPAGRCSFMDRYQVRLELNWRVVPGAPDTSRMLSDYTARLKEQGVEDIHCCRQGAWTGLIGRQDQQVVSRYGRYFETEKCLIELVLPWPAERDEPLERRILDSIGVEEARNGLRRWRVFGMDIAVPENYALKTCRQHAGRTELLFRPPRGFGEMRFMRLGLVSNWLRTPLDRWMESEVPDAVRIDGREDRTGSRNRETCLHGRVKLWHRGIHLRRPIYEACAGISPDDGRLYFTARQSCARTSRLPLNCCQPSPSPPPSPSPSAQADGAVSEAWVGMLHAVPVQNEAARTETRHGHVIVQVPLSARRGLKAPLSWIVPLHRERRAVLDELGRQIWERCTGDQTVEQIIDAFARTHTLTFHEARVSVTGYLKQLIQRGILAVDMGERI